jgi:hypothetical protein
MLLTLSTTPAKPEFSFRTPHGSPTLFHSSSARYPSQGPGDSSSRSLPASDTGAMSATHRGLPPPAAMTLPDPSRPAPEQQPPPPPRPLPPAMPQWQGQMPAPPPQWQGAEESMRNWLHARAEEDRRKQEEEKTRQENLRLEQENLRLEQRKIEQSMLRDSLQAGIPPHLVPVVFAGISGTNIGFEVLQNYYAQVQASLPAYQAAPQPHGSPDSRRDSRLLNQPQTGAFASAPPPSGGGPPPGLQAAPVLQQSVFAAAGPSASPGRPRAHTIGHAGPPVVRGPPGHNPLPRLTTGEMMSQGPGPHPLQQAQTVPAEPSQQQQQSPSIYFHHWVPPSSQAGSGSGQGPPTPSNKPAGSSSQKHRSVPSHTSESEYSSSPKKRKAQGGHTAAPPPTSAPPGQQTSPSFSQASSQASTPGRRGGGHSRARSDVSLRGVEASGAGGRPTSHPAAAGMVGGGAAPAPAPIPTPAPAPTAAHHPGFPAAVAGGVREGSAEGSRATSAEHQAPPGPYVPAAPPSTTTVESVTESGNTMVGRSNYEFAGGPHETRQATSSAPGSPRRESAGGVGPAARPA